MSIGPWSPNCESHEERKLMVELQYAADRIAALEAELAEARTDLSNVKIAFEHLHTTHENAVKEIRSTRAEVERYKVDAERWRALLTVGRIRILGRAGFPEEQGTVTKYRHFGAEFWTVYPGDEPPSRFAVKTLTDYADAARSQPCE